MTKGVREEIRTIFASRARFDEPLARYTTMGVGGVADAFAEVESETELAALLTLCAEEGTALLVIGSGSNLIVRDGGWRGVAAKLVGEDFLAVSASGGRITAGAGALLRNLIAEAARRALSGLERLAGIPGTVGGAAKMNAGAGGVAFGDFVSAARLMDRAGKPRRLSGCEMGFSYRGCAALERSVLLSVELALSEGRREEIEKEVRLRAADHSSRIPPGPSAGSVFRNPPSGPSAGELIEAAGLKGTRVGGAVVSSRHANVIVNGGGASARDVIALVRRVRRRVREVSGIELECEIEVVGEE